MFGEQCCTSIPFLIPMNTALDGTFTNTMEKFKKLQAETENAGRNACIWHGLEKVLENGGP